MQTLTAKFLNYEMPQIRAVIATYEGIEILTERNIPNTNLVEIDIMCGDPSDLFTIGGLVAMEKLKIYLNPRR